MQQLSKTATMYRFFTAIQTLLNLYVIVHTRRIEKENISKDYDTFMKIHYYNGYE